MNIIYFGSSDFGIPCLKDLLRHHTLLAVITSPDKPGGRHLRLLKTPVKEWAEKHEIPVLEPGKITGTEFPEKLKAKNPGLFVVISYGQILTRDILSVPSTASLNVHPSLLPKFRGAAPIEWALIEGENKTGISVNSIEVKIDTGNIIESKEILILPEDDYFSLKQKLMEQSPDLLDRAIKKVSAGFKGEPQTGKATYARKLKKEDGHINWSKNTMQIHNLVRGTVNWPGAFSYVTTPKGRKILKIKKMETVHAGGNQGIPGTLFLRANGIEVACGTGSVALKTLQFEGKKEIGWKEFLCGYSSYLQNVKLDSATFKNGEWY